MRKEYATMEAVEDDLFYYIEVFCNRKRLHSTLGYMSPVAFRIKKRLSNRPELNKDCVCI